MPTGEQLVENNTTQFRTFGGPGVNRVGQKMTITDRIISHLSFKIWRTGSPAGNVTYTIRRVSDDGLLASQVLMAANALQLTATWEELEFTVPVGVNEEVRILCECPTSAAPDYINIRFASPSEKANEEWTGYITDWDDRADRDATYIYTYEEVMAGGVVKGSPTAQLISAGFI